MDLDVFVLLGNAARARRSALLTAEELRAQAERPEATEDDRITAQYARAAADSIVAMVEAAEAEGAYIASGSACFLLHAREASREAREAEARLDALPSRFPLLASYRAIARDAWEATRAQLSGQFRVTVDEAARRVTIDLPVSVGVDFLFAEDGALATALDRVCGASAVLDIAGSTPDRLVFRPG